MVDASVYHTHQQLEDEMCRSAWRPLLVGARLNHCVAFNLSPVTSLISSPVYSPSCSVKDPRAGFSQPDHVLTMPRPILPTTGLVSVVVGHYWIGFCGGADWFWIGFDFRGAGPGALLYWIGYTLSETQLV